MLRALLFATLFFVSSRVASGQELSVLHIKVVVVDAEQKATPVPRHALLVSDNPATAAPRQIVTAPDGTADVRLRPGNYTVESDRPVVFHGKAYQWTQTVDIVAGRDAVLELTADNAEVEPATTATASAVPLEADPSFLLPQWQDSVVALWTPSTHASGFLIDAKGLIATNQRVIGTATSVEVQLSPDVKVAARVLAADPALDVAVLWIDPKVSASLRPVPLACAQAAKPPVGDGQELFTIGAPLREQKGMTSGTVSRVEPHAIVSDFRLASGSAGGPVFTAGGGVVGITSIADDKNASRRGVSRVVRIDDACDVVASAEKKMKDAAPPDGTHLPVRALQRALAALAFPGSCSLSALQTRVASPCGYLFFRFLGLFRRLGIFWLLAFFLFRLAVLGNLLFGAFLVLLQLVLALLACLGLLLLRAGQRPLVGLALPLFRLPCRGNGDEAFQPVDLRIEVLAFLALRSA